MRQDQANVTLTVDGREIKVKFAKRTGGTGDSEEVKYPPGGMDPEVARGGRPTTENVSLAGEYRPDADQADIDFLKARRGKGEASASEQPLDVDGNAFGKPQTWRGILKAANTGDYDSESGDIREIEVEISTHAVQS